MNFLFTMSNNAQARDRTARTQSCKPFHHSDEQEDQRQPPAKPLELNTVVEPDGIEPTTSCLQSTRSPN